MSIYKLNRDDFDGFLDTMKGGYEVYTPQKAEEGWRFAPADGTPQLDGYLLTRLSAKQFVFPLYESIIDFDDGAGESNLPNDGLRLLFGVRPCDAHAIKLLDAAFAGVYKDPHYLARRENTLLFVLACDSPAPSCFCTSTAGGPGGSFGADVMVYDSGDGWVFKPVSGKGEAALKDAGLDSADDKELANAKAVSKEAAKDMNHLWELGEAQEAVKVVFDDELWDDLTERCIACGVCTYVCPSCSCFDVSDEAKRDKGRRYRFWDGCMFSLFTLHASGHNPRTAAAQRYRQRVLHKFHYYPQRNDGLNLCVGCGRCVVDCPVNIDIREAVQRAVEIG